MLSVFDLFDFLEQDVTISVPPVVKEKKPNTLMSEEYLDKWGFERVKYKQLFTSEFMTMNRHLKVKSVTEVFWTPLLDTDLGDDFVPTHPPTQVPHMTDGQEVWMTYGHWRRAPAVMADFRDGGVNILYVNPNPVVF